MLDALVAISLRVSLLCLVGVAFTLLLRRSSPILRHRVWTVVVSGSLFVPVLLFIIPVIHIPLETTPAPIRQAVISGERLEVVPASSARADSPARPDMNGVAPTSQPSPSTPPALTEPSEQPMQETLSHRQPGLEIPLIIVWLSGILWMVARGLWQFSILRRLVWSSHVLMDPTWLNLRDDLSAKIGLRRKVKLLQSDCTDVPFTWGLWKPYILLPASRFQWSDDWRQMIFLHELTHVHRQDNAINALAWLARTVYWFNPLIWIACHRLSVEAEHATDTRVLESDVDRIHYAELLVDFVRQSSPGLPVGGTAMISKTTLTARVQNILNFTHGDHRSAKSGQWFIASILILFITLIGGVQLVSVAAQSSEITLTVTMIEGMEYLEDSRVFEQFEEANPNVRVNVEYQAFTGFLPSPVNDIDAHLNGVDAYTLSGDVLIVSAGASMPPEVSLEATQAGYYLDLNPLIQADLGFDPTVFYSSAWESARWNGGTWLLPLAIQIYTVIYDIEAFDAADSPYPDTDWRTEDYITTIQALATQDASGTTAPGFIGYNRSDHALLYSLLGRKLTDATSATLLPTFTEPQILTFAEQWGQLLNTGAVYNPSYPYPDDFTPSIIPLTTDRLQETTFSDDAATLMPGSTSGITVSGFAVSSRTEHPETAYQLALYLANDVRVADALVTSFSMTTRARPTYDERDAIEDAPFLLGEFSEDNQLLLEQAIENAVPVSELLFFDYFLSGLRQAINSNGNVQAALEEAQLRAQDNLRFASDRRDEITGSVITDTRDVELQPGEISLRFGLDSTTNISNPNLWDLFIADFVDADPDVGEVIIDSRSLTVERAVEAYDCFYLPFNAVSVADRDMLLTLDPLLSADPTFEQENFWPNVLQQVTQDNRTWAYPIDMYPLLVWYNESLLTGIPESSQTIQGFYDVLATQFADEAVVVAPNLGTTLLMLIAADGGLPIDFRADPPLIDFTGHLAPIRRVLDLAKNDIIHYEPLTNLTVFNAPTMPTITIQPWGAVTFDSDGYVPALFPQGSRYTPVAFNLGTAYISRSAVNPEACYRFISMLSQQPELFTGIPVQQMSTLLDDLPTSVPELEMVLGRPDTVIFPYSARGGVARDVVLSYWLYRAFDRYVLDDANLDAEIIEAERLSQEYLLCTDALPPYDPANQSSRERNRQYVECALQVDPASQEYFSFGNG